MNLKFCATFLLSLASLATAAADFTLVYRSNELDYEWPSEERRTQALKNGTFNPTYLKPCFITVYKNKAILTLYAYHITTIPVTLVILPTSGTSSEFPNLIPFLQWNMHGIGNSDNIIEARGKKVDSKGRLWLLDSGSDSDEFKISAKLRIIDKANKETIISYSFPFHGLIYDLVLDETPEGTFAYIITRLGKQHIIVFSLERKQHWIVDTPGKRPGSIALSPKEPSHLYFSSSNVLYSIPIAELRNGPKTANPKRIGEWEATPSSMDIDKQGILYAAFIGKNYIRGWNTSQKFEKQVFHEVPGLNGGRPDLFIALDENGTLWISVFNINGDPKYSLWKVEDPAKLFVASPEFRGETSDGEEDVAENGTNQCVIWIMIGVIALLIFLGVVVWLIYKYSAWCPSLMEKSPKSNLEDPSQSVTSVVDKRSKNAHTKVAIESEDNCNNNS